MSGIKLNISYSGIANGCTTIRGINPAYAFNHSYFRGNNYCLETYLNINDPYIAKNVYSLKFSRWQQADQLDLVKHYKALYPDAKFYYELDDDFWNIPEYNPAHKVYTENTFYFIEQIISFCDGIICSTEGLANQMKRFNKPIAILPNAVFKSQWYNPYRLDLVNDIKKIKIIYSGANGHFSNDNDGDFAGGWFEALSELFEQDKITLALFGNTPNKLKKYQENIINYDQCNYMQYSEVIKNNMFDLMICPISEHVFNESKSNIRLLEGSAAGIPVLCSDTKRVYQPYSDATIKTINDKKSIVSAIKKLFSKEYRLAVISSQFQVMEDKGYYLESESYLKNFKRIHFNE